MFTMPKFLTKVLTPANITLAANFLIKIVAGKGPKQETYLIPGLNAPKAKHQEHLRQEVQIGPFKVFATGSQYVDAPVAFEASDFSFFLDKASWTEILQDYPFDSPNVTIIDWPDFGVLKDETFAQLVDSILVPLRHGLDVTVGCIGAHGRTGTLLTALTGVVERVDADEALRRVRARFCSHAVETEMQLELVRRTLARLA